MEDVWDRANGGIEEEATTLYFAQQISNFLYIHLFTLIGWSHIVVPSFLKYQCAVECAWPL